MRGMRLTSAPIIRAVARAAMFGWFRSVEVDGMERVPTHGPILLVAPHFNGVVDPALLAATLPRTPRFLAMAKLWKVPGLRPVLAFVGAVPVYRSSDGSTRANVGTFDECYRVMAAGGAIAIFPEGRINERFRLLPLKTGAARIALGARREGVNGVTIVPVGLVFEHRTAIRSRAMVRVGEPIPMEREIEDLVRPGEPDDDRNHVIVGRLTEEIRRRLQATTVDFDDAEQAHTLAFAAQVALRPLEGPSWREVPLGASVMLADRLARAPAATRQAVVDASTGYRSSLRLIGLEDRDVIPGNTPARFRRRYQRRAARYLAAAPFAAIGTVVNAAPAAAVYAAGRRSKAKMRATMRLLTALVAFPSAWLGTALWLRSRGHVHPWLEAVAAGPGCGWAALRAFERFARNRRDLIAWRHLRGAQSALAGLRDQRAALVRAVDAATADDAGPTAAAIGAS